MADGNAVAVLREQAANARALIANLQDLLGDDTEAMATAVEGETDIHEAIGAGLTRLCELDALMNGVACLIANLKDRGDRFEKQRDNIRTAIAVAMEAGGIKKVEHAIGTVSLKSVPPKVVVSDEALIPARFWKAADPKLDKQGIAKALKDGEAVLGATLSNGSMTIQIKAT